MLLELEIRDFAIIDRLSLTLRPGLNVLTGETGAGKSIIIDALGAVLGDRTGADVVRTGASRSTVDATFDISQMSRRSELAAAMDELGIEAEEGTLILSREIAAAGRNNARVNGRAVTAGALQRLGRLLVDIHGQSEHLSLLRPEQHLLLVDQYAGTTKAREEFSGLVTRIRALRTQIELIERGSRDRAQRVDLLEFQVGEIYAAELRIGEEEELINERRVLSSAERLATEASEAFVLLNGGDVEEILPALQAAKKASHLIEGLATIDESLESLSARLNEQVFLLEDLAAEIRIYRDEIEADPLRLELVEERLDLLQKLKRKYGETIADVIAYGAHAQQELESLTGGEGSVDAIRSRLDALEEVAGSAAQRLSKSRADASVRMAKDIERAIAELDMGHAKMEVRVSQRDDPDGLRLTPNRAPVAFDSTGADHVEFLLAPNLGEQLKPLARVASGGEMARLMLAIKSTLSDADSTPTLVFDEVDTGVGGRSGKIVGEKLWDLTHAHQVLVITHLSQIAAYGDAHYQITKRDKAGLTVSSVHEISGPERIEELAEMLSGKPPTPTSRRNAEELLERIEDWKRNQTEAIAPTG
jgi:DNA repair protein RecN (Recombination protein N)